MRPFENKESPSMPSTGPLCGAASIDRALYTISHGEPRFLYNLPTPSEAPCPALNSVFGNFFTPTYFDPRMPYMPFIPLHDPWHGLILGRLAYTSTTIPILEIEPGWWGLRPAIIDEWKVLEESLIGIVRAIMHILPSTFNIINFSWPSQFGYRSLQRKSVDARRRAMKSIDGFLPLVAQAAYVMWTIRLLEEASEAAILDWRQRVCDLTGVHVGWLSQLELEVADFSVPRIGAIFDFSGDPGTNKAVVEPTNAFIHLLGEKVVNPMTPKLKCCNFIPVDAAELEYLRKLPGRVKFSAWKMHRGEGTFSSMRETNPFVHPSRAAGDASTLADEASTPTSSFLFPVESGTGQKAGETMARFFARRERSNQEMLLAENDDQKKRRAQREENAAKGRAPGKKGALVFVWELRGGNYIRTPGGRNKYEDLWDEYSAAQRRYDSFRNEWDLCEEFDQVETKVDRRPIKMVEDDDDDDDDVWQMLSDTLPSGFTQIDPSASVADLNRMHPLPLPSVTTESPTVIKTSSDMVEEAVYRRFGCDLGLQQEKIQSARTLPKDVILAKTLGDRDTPRLAEAKWHNLGVFFAECKDLVNDLSSIHLLDFNYPTSRINSDWKMDVKRLEIGVSSVDQKPAHYLVQEVDDPGPLFIIVKSATTALEIIRQNWGPGVGDVAEHMLARGMPFHVCTKSSRCLFPPPAPVADPLKRCTRVQP
ncbi:hypothetical protein C8F04DRAFT_1279578 [Mycena alexandri]|uniref:Uncharacterized protein n=1 Tax=Mycena alexandri TaxID=1745969 RepID=A0AAD6WLY5_9AGAR|nr:hypothetical protein C8F04DRAFT_1279578 [Mycena alexandri]